MGESEQGGGRHAQGTKRRSLRASGPRFCSESGVLRFGRNFFCERQETDRLRATQHDLDCRPRSSGPSGWRRADENEATRGAMP